MVIVDADRKCYLPVQTSGYCRPAGMTDTSAVTKPGVRRDEQMSNGGMGG